jgi:ubiquinone/menaquinone biosynthesis C-methylase UbiE
MAAPTPTPPGVTDEGLSAAGVGEREHERLIRVYRSDILPAGSKWDLTNVGNQLIERERWDATAEILDQCGGLPLSGRDILEVGCGSGKVLQQLVRMGADAGRCVGVDLLPERIAVARVALPQARFVCANAERLEFSHASFDFAVASTLFSSLWTIDATVASEMARVLKPGGSIIYYDSRYDNPGNRHVHGLTIPYLRRLFPGFEFRLRSVTLVPAVARRLGWHADRIYRALVTLPPLRTHYVGLLRKPELSRVAY